MQYDGHGRLWKRHKPSQWEPNGQILWTTYGYNADDLPLTATDARGATTHYEHNNRHLVTDITYSAPAPIPSRLRGRSPLRSAVHGVRHR